MSPSRSSSLKVASQPTSSSQMSSPNSSNTANGSTMTTTTITRTASPTTTNIITNNLPPKRSASGTTTGISLSPNVQSPTTINGKGFSNSLDLAAGPSSVGAAGTGTAAGGRSTPQSASVFSNSFILNRPGSASAINRRRSENVSSPTELHFPGSHHHHHPHSANPAAIHHHPYQNVFEEEGITFIDDDEQDKGHGLGRRASAGFSANSGGGRWTPTILSNMLRKAEGRFSPVSMFNSPNNTSGTTTTNSNVAGSGSGVGSHTAVPSTTYSKSGQPLSPRFKLMYADPEEMTEAEKEAVDLTDHNTSGGRNTPARYRPTTESGQTKLGLLLEQSNPESTGMKPSNSNESIKYKNALRGSGKLNGVFTPQSPVMKSIHPLSHTHKLSTASSTSASSHSIKMHSPQMMSHSRHASLHKAPLQASPVIASTSGGQGMNSSPLIIPQARRGAVNLRQATRRGKGGLSSAARRNKANAHSIPFHRQIIQIIQLAFWALIHPIGAFKRFSSFISKTMHDIDQAFRDPRTGARVWRPTWLGAYIPLLIWLVVSLSSTFTVLIWHTEVFQGLDRLSSYLQSLGLTGRLILGFLIFITTFPPLPLYSTLIILCGFSFGLVQGFIISYIAALSGAIIVFILSRSLLKSWMVGLLNQSGGLKKVVRAIEKRPKLLFLVRLAPYPYNLMNTLLASSPTLTLKTYTLCTALALPKLLVHCGLGTTIKNFAAYNGAANSSPDPSKTGSTLIGGDDPNAADQAKASETAELIKHVFGFVGVGLCVGIFLYLFSVARKAVDEELDGDELAADEYELMASDGEYSEDGLEEDELNIANGMGNDSSRNVSSDGSREDVNGNQRNSSQSFSRGNHGTSGSYAGRHSDTILVDGRYMPVSGRLSAVNHKSHESSDGTTPLFIAQGGGGTHGDGSGSTAKDGGFFTQWNQTNSRSSLGNQSRENTFTSRRYMDSSTSLAESIAEMEKHANAMEGDHDIYGTENDQRHDISIEFSPPPTIKGLPSQKQRNSTGDYKNLEDEEDGVNERSSLVNLDRDRVSRRSQMGYEEDIFGHSSHETENGDRAFTPKVNNSV